MYCPINRASVCWQEKCAWWNTDMQKCCMALLSINQPIEEKLVCHHRQFAKIQH